MLSYRQVIHSLFLPLSFFIEIRWYCHTIDQITDQIYLCHCLSVVLKYIRSFSYIYNYLDDQRFYLNLLVNGMKITLIIRAMYNLCLISINLTFNFNQSHIKNVLINSVRINNLFTSNFNTKVRSLQLNRNMFHHTLFPLWFLNVIPVVLWQFQRAYVNKNNAFWNDVES